jgi:hypothetical protein
VWSAFAFFFVLLLHLLSSDVGFLAMISLMVPLASAFIFCCLDFWDAPGKEETSLNATYPID